jgi:uncharacterized protein (DUF111 family)
MSEKNYWRMNTVSVLESEIDDMTGQLLGHVLEEGLRLGALDVHYTPVQMKKNRPGVRLTLLCRGSDQDRFIDFIFRQTTSLGVRVWSVQRAELERDTVTVQRDSRRFSVKRGLGPDGEILNEAPEFEDLKALARSEDRPLKRLLQKWYGRKAAGGGDAGK